MTSSLPLPLLPIFGKVAATVRSLKLWTATGAPIPLPSFYNCAFPLVIEFCNPRAGGENHGLEVIQHGPARAEFRGEAWAIGHVLRIYSPRGIASRSPLVPSRHSGSLSRQPGNCHGYK